MKSVTMEHLEAYNREFNFDFFWDTIKDIDVTKNPDDFYKNILEAIFKSNPLLREKHLDANKEYERIKDDEEGIAQTFATYRVMFAIACWLEYRQIYKFDLDTLKLVSNSEFKDLTNEELKALKMPYSTFIIENDFNYREEIIDTILVNKQLVDNGDVVLMIYGFIKNGNSEKMLRLDLIIEENKSINEFLNESVQDDCQEFIKKIMNLIMYLCQPKVEILKKSVEKKEDTTNKKKIKHFYKVSYDSNEVGVTLGNAIRNYKYIYEKGDTLSNPDKKKGSIKKPHLRAGHFQGYWVGKGRNTLVPKYIEPIFVKGGASKIATIHKVK